MLLHGSYKGTRKRRWARPRTIEEIFGIDTQSLRKLGFSESEIVTMARSDYFQKAEFLGASDVKNGQLLIVEQFEEIKTRIGTRPILRVKGFEKPLGLNATNYDFMVEKFGENEKNWAGKKIKVAIIQVNNPQTKKMQPGIRFE